MIKPSCNPISMTIRSCNELKSLRTLVISAMLIATYVVLDMFSIPIMPSLTISLTFLPLALVAMMYGPVVAGIVSAIADTISFLIKPTGTFFFVFTIIAFITGFIYGILLYGQKVSIQRISITKLIINVVCHLLLNTWGLSILLGKSVWILIPPRIIKNLIALPIEIFVIYVVLKFFQHRIKKQFI